MSPLISADDISDTTVFQHEDGSWGNAPMPGVQYYDQSENRAERRARKAAERNQMRKAKREIKRLTRGSIFDEA